MAEAKGDIKSRADLEYYVACATGRQNHYASAAAGFSPFEALTGQTPRALSSAAFDAALDAEMTYLEEQQPRKRRKQTVAPVIMEATLDLLNGSRGSLHLQTRASGRLAVTPNNNAFVAAADGANSKKQRAASKLFPRNEVERVAAARGISLDLVRQWEKEQSNQPASRGHKAFVGLKALGIEVEQLPAMDIWTAKG